jgi:hypothetical protein
MTRAVIVCLILALVSDTAFAGCIEEALPELAPGTALTILKTDGTRVRATFVRAEATRWTLNAAPLYARRTPRRLELAPSEIERLETSPPGHVRSKTVLFSMVSGFVLGVAVGALVPERRDYYSFATDSPAPNPWDLPGSGYGERRVILWGVAGAAVGTFAGIAIGHVRGKPRSWSCADSPPGTAPAAPDSIR